MIGPRRAGRRASRPAGLRRRFTRTRRPSADVRHPQDRSLDISATRLFARRISYSIDVDREVSLTAIYESVENGWVQARIREMPGVITAAPTRAEAEVMLLDALQEFLLSFGTEEGAVLPGAGHDERPVHIVLSA